MVTRKEFVVNGSDERLDMFLSRSEPDLSRSQVQRLMDEGCVLLNGSAPKPSRKLHPGDRVSLILPPPRPVELVPEDIPLDIVYQDGELLVVDKPAGLSVHPGPGHPSHTLVNALLSICPDLKGIGGELRPGIIHRLDKDTSGLVVVAKSAGAHRRISEQMKERSVHKVYLALISGRVKPEEGTVDGPVGRDPRNRKRMAVVAGGRDASTGYKALRYFAHESDAYTLVEATPKTGRTHQIRVHFSAVGHPLVGDSLYGRRSPLLGRQFLHAHRLGFRHPSIGRYMEFTSPLPAELRSVIEVLDLGK